MQHITNIPVIIEHVNIIIYKFDSRIWEIIVELIKRILIVTVHITDPAIAKKKKLMRPLLAFAQNFLPKIHHLTYVSNHTSENKCFCKSTDYRSSNVAVSVNPENCIVEIYSSFIKIIQSRIDATNAIPNPHMINVKILVTFIYVVYFHDLII